MGGREDKFIRRCAACSTESDEKQASSANSIFSRLNPTRKPLLCVSEACDLVFHIETPRQHALKEPMPEHAGRLRLMRFLFVFVCFSH